MSKEVSVGNMVEKLNEQYERYNPSYYLFRLSSLNQGNDSKTIAKIKKVDGKLKDSIYTLCRDLLRFHKGNVVLQSDYILNLLNEEYAPLINELKDEQCLVAKGIYKEWNIAWLVSSLKDSELMWDEDYANKYNLPINKELKNKINNLRENYFCSDEILEYFQEDDYEEDDWDDNDEEEDDWDDDDEEDF